MDNEDLIVTRPADAPDVFEFENLGDQDLGDDDPDTAPFEAPGWATWWPTDLESVEWVTLTLVGADMERAEIQERAKARIDAVKAWEAKELSAIDRRTSYLDRVAVTFARRWRRVAKKASVRFPSGVVLKTTAVPERACVVEADALVAWLEKHEIADAVAKRPLISHVPLRLVDGRVFGPDGEEIPGVEARPESLSVSWKAAA